MKKEHNPIICAIDTHDLNIASTLCKNLAPYVGMAKLGLEFFMAHGPSGLRIIGQQGLPIFLDVKLHDIPNTVSKAIQSLSALDLAMITVHTAGGSEMMKVAAASSQENAAKQNKAAPLLIGVTVMTSLDEKDLEQIGIHTTAREQVERLSLLAKASGLDGVVCSAHEVEFVKKSCGTDFITVVPGIRPANASIHDQKRVLTPPQALAKGADYLVIGRPITEDTNPVEAAKSIQASLK